MEKIRAEIQWMYNNNNNINELRIYFLNFLGKERVSQLSNTAINDLLEIRANDLYMHYQELSRQKNRHNAIKDYCAGVNDSRKLTFWQQN